MDQLPGLLDTLDLKVIPGKAGRVNPLTGLLNEVVNPPVLNQPDPRIITGPQRQQNFQNWFQNSKVVDDGGRPLTLYHGTTHDFDEFNPEIGETGNYFGSAIYMTDSPDDASINYGIKGPDLENRVERRHDQLMHDLEDPDQLPGQEEDEENQKRMYEKARKELIGPAERVLPVHAAIQNPLYLTRAHDSQIGNRNWVDFKKIFNIAAYPPDQSDFESEDEYYEAQDEYFETSGNQMFEEISDTLRSAFYESDDEANYKWADFSEHVLGPLLDKAMEEEGEVKPHDINKIIRENSYMADHFNPGETIKKFFQKLGYDGIIMDASDYFPNMNYTDDAKHYIIFDPTKVKGMFNRGTYDPNNPDYLSRVTPQTGLIG